MQQTGSSTTIDIQGQHRVPLHHVGASYPILGIFHFVKTPKLWLRVICHLIISVAIALALIIMLFSFGMKLQADLLTKHIPAGLAWTAAVLLVIIESAVVTILTGLIYLQAFALDNIFDTVMADHGYPVSKLTENSPKGFLRGFYRFLHPILYALMTLVALPLHLIPVVGTVLFLICVSYFAAWGAHLHYFDLKGLTWSDASRYIRSHWAQYFQFGYPAGLLEAIPVAGLFFMMTNVIGGALWAVDLEKTGEAPRV